MPDLEDFERMRQLVKHHAVVEQQFLDMRKENEQLRKEIGSLRKEIVEYRKEMGEKK